MIARTHYRLSAEAEKISNLNLSSFNLLSSHDASTDQNILKALLDDRSLYHIYKK